MKKELTKIAEFQVFKTTPDRKPPPGHQRIPCHIIFDVKFDGRRKARLVAEDTGLLTLEKMCTQEW